MQSGVFAVKMPLLRVAHPSDEDCKRKLDRLKRQPAYEANADDFEREVSTKGVPKGVSEAKNPLLFDFNHNYDPELTPRRSWQQKVATLESRLEQAS